MIVEFVHYRVPPARAAAFELAFYQGQAPLRAAPACVAADLTRDQSDEARYLVRLQWTDADERASFLHGGGGRVWRAAMAAYDDAIVQTECHRPVQVFDRGCC
ncbi:MAG: antibiotic biosynthesis monooxygenase [Myxococcales bacterium]|nr:antibiotic biosynthesis monooxygenase [Myxococcales bacterium]